MRTGYDQDTDHIVANLLKKKGYIQFDYGYSRIKNEHSGWWSHSVQHEELRDKYLGETLKEVVWMLKMTNELPELPDIREFTD